MNLLAIDLAFRDPSEVIEIISDLWAERPIPADYHDDDLSHYNRDVELWYCKMQEMAEALEEANSIEHELNSLGSL